MKYAGVILPVPVGNTFTYRIPDEFDDFVQVGMRVVVPFGQKKMYTGVVAIIHTFKPELPYEIRDIICPLDNTPILRNPQLKFWEWISTYYMAYVGEVYQAAVPTGLKPDSETMVCVNPDFEVEEVLPEKEQKILDILSDGKPVAVDNLSKITAMRSLMPNLKRLLARGAIQVNEEFTEKYHAKTETYVRLMPEARYEDKLQAIFDELSKARKQLDLLMFYIDLSKCLNPKLCREVSKKELLEKSGVSAAILTNLVEKGIFELYKKVVGRLDTNVQEISEKFDLNTFQQLAYNEIEHKFSEHQVVLLHGVTSSGKTEIYIHLINKIIAEGKQVLYLVPEIALTTQLTSRLKRIFGNQLGVYHSKFSDSERVEIWNKVLQDKGYDVILGVRSSVFLPFRQLGLVIVDEEHDSSFKQYDPPPRYNARNVAIVLAGMHGAKTLLGSATPSVESYYNAKTGKFGFVELNQRFLEIEMPEILVCDIKEAYRKKCMNGHFSDILLQKMKIALDSGEQVILFQNRRGYAPYIECKACAYVPKCKNCDVSLTVHKVFNTLTCHYCGFSISIPTVCPACNTPSLFTKGFGTEQIEDELKLLFPEAKVGRMDLDTTRSKKSYEKLITAFEQRTIDILIGTQMVTKGLDFENVSLVGILNADNMLNYPDFRAHERAFQLMTQVSGRCGRKNKRGLVVLQTSTPEHPVIQQVLQHNFTLMYETQYAQRFQYHYPPFVRMVEITVKHKDVNTVKNAAIELKNRMRSVFGGRVLGPVEPAVSRIQNLYLRQVLLKIENTASPVKAKELLQEIIHNLVSESSYRRVIVSIDVDPM